MTYYDNLINDKKRVNAFFKAIEKKVHGITYDIGTGSGILAEHASKYADKVYAIENNPLIINKTKKVLSKYDNIIFLNEDASVCSYVDDIDVVICEMLDTALIDEEQVPVINNVVKYTDSSVEFIPKAVYSTVELISTRVSGITYYEDNHPNYISLSQEVKYHYVKLSEYNDPEFEKNIKINPNGDGVVNAIKITTYTVVTDDILLNPTPMLNPPLIIPINEFKVKCDEEVIIELKYIMGGGINSIRATNKTNI